MSWGITVPMYVPRACLRELDDQRETVRVEIEVLEDELKAFAFAGPAALPMATADERWEWVEYAPHRVRSLLSELRELYVRAFQLAAIADTPASEAVVDA